MANENDIIELGTASEVTQGLGGQHEDVGIGRDSPGLSND